MAATVCWNEQCNGINKQAIPKRSTEIIRGIDDLPIEICRNEIAARGSSVRAASRIGYGSVIGYSHYHTWRRGRRVIEAIRNTRDVRVLIHGGRKCRC